MNEYVKREVSCRPTCCKLDALVSIDERGQIVLPKEIREKAQLNAGDKLALITCEKNGNVSCITLIKADQFKDAIKKVFGPLLQELMK